MPATLALSAGNIVCMNSQDPQEQDIVRSWYSNAAPWTRAVREASIASRKLVTDQAIIDAASARKCDLIVMASHGRHGISALVLGSETVKVLTHCKIPVLVHR